ncbi:carbamate kinase [Silvimonas iriomotensis]|uniref:Carbamate kinase n=1 Tax=Silvimonas iriomotensis TaxID=449662 RepID=A0ABQ2PCU4_9NEIS|nr:carbamate kinase [Silvimonas iriomotensis]GGP23138.1 carbamate kinase [Silvimonas iriomotensis]
MNNPQPPLAVIAVGGNALIRDDAHASIPDQSATVTATVEHIADLIAAGWRVVVTHGNGPQVGFILRRSEIAAGEVCPVPLDFAVGDTQGAIGYMFQRALGNALAQRNLARPVVSVVTQTRVNPADPAFARPDKPVGAFMDEATARARAAELGWSIMPDSGRGWRRTVASPQPQEIVETDVISALLERGTVVIACGGGGIPVVRDDAGQLQGVEAVIDKDRASALLAEQLGADLLLIPTGVAQVAVRFGQPDQQWLSRLTLEQADALIASGELGAGSMQPKVEAIAGFVARSAANGKQAQGLITSPECIVSALAGQTGTWISA